LFAVLAPLENSAQAISSPPILVALV